MKATVILSADQIKKAEIADKVVVVIDVLRATSTIITGMANGCKEVIPVATIEKAKRVADDLPADYLLAGERGGSKIKEFDLGNSPRSYTAEKISKKKIILTTTNGTKCFIRLEPAQRVLIGSLLNLETVIKKVIGEEEVIFCCAGRRGKFALDDFVTAGKMIVKLKGKANVELTDTARAAADFYLYNQDNLLNLLKQTASGKNLVSKGKEEDINFIGKKKYSLVPVYKAGKIT